MTELSSVHLLIIAVVTLSAIALDIYVVVRLVRLREGLSGRVVLWGVITLLVPIIGALATLVALPRQRTLEHGTQR